MCRLCIVSVSRIILVQQVTNADQTYNAALLTCFTLLESQLGIVLACLPIIRPAAVKLRDSTANTLTRRLISTGKGSTTDNRAASSTIPSSVNSKKRNFHRLHDNMYPFTNASTTVNEVQSTALDDLEAIEGTSKPGYVPQEGIQVTRTWDNQRSPGN